MPQPAFALPSSSGKNVASSLECPFWICKRPPSLPLITDSLPPVGGMVEHSFFIRAQSCRGPCSWTPTSSCVVGQVSIHKTVT